MSAYWCYPFNIPGAIIDTGFRTMDSTFQSMQSGCSFPRPLRMIQSGLSTMNTVLNAMQTSVQILTGQERCEAPAEPPLNGPRDIDSAAADFIALPANQTLRFTEGQAVWEKVYQR
jgi:hypothetical protein